MSSRAAMMDARAVLARTDQAQADAADPLVSAWVNANAGTGKTYVLTLRVLRLLLAGTPPERILCLTYTKAAAAEMSKRVFDRLADWVTAPDEALSEQLTKVLRRAPQATELTFARTLFTKAIETPGGLKVQTIHAFAERLLQRFPLEAGVPPGFRILDDERGRELKARSIDATLTAATGDPGNSLGQALNVAIRYAAEASFDDLLSAAIAERQWLDTAARLLGGTKQHDDFATAEAYLRKQFGLPADLTAAQLDAARGSVLNDQTMRGLRDHLASGKKEDDKQANRLTKALAQAAPAARVTALAAFFLANQNDKKEKCRDNVMSKGLAAERPDLNQAALEAQARFWALTQQATALRAVDATAALYRLAGDVLQHYTAAKRVAGALDFDDLIVRTTNLLSDSASASWVLFKLDGGLDHILVDEAQDTSPEQWDIISALAAEFFSGAGAHEGRRTVFAVGDEKQSIYSFQGAVPEMFASMGQRFAALAQAAGMPWRVIPLNLSFRTVQAVLDAVDTVFADPARTPGVTAAGAALQHFASRANHSGIVELWPTETAAEADPASPWQPLSDNAETAPANRLAERIADVIDGWLKSGERLRSEDRPIRAGDILILVRKRNPFAVPMVAALKRRNIPVAGSDRIALTEQIAVQDLLVLGDFLTLPEDDLALATVLKGPLFDLTDEHLMALAPQRKASLWRALLAHAKDDTAFRPAAETLKQWRAKADFTPPYEFYSSLLDREGARARFLNRLGPEAADAIDEFLDLALTYDDGAPPSLTGFLASLRAADREVKRDMEHGRNEVRVMTVHGAKGLEAPIVFLPDTCTTKDGNGASARLLEMPNLPAPGVRTVPIIWRVKGTARVPQIVAAAEAEEEAATAERNRLLYVAMTRARDRLYVGGFEGRNGRQSGCWYDLISDALAPHLREAESLGGFKVSRVETQQAAPPTAPAKTILAAPQAAERPPFALTRAAAEPRLSVPLAPSRLEPYAPDAEGEPLPRPKRDVAQPSDVPSPRTAAGETRFLRGTLTHALLQHLPALPHDRRAAAAAAFIERRGAALPLSVRNGIVAETLAILAHDKFAAIFGAGSMAEVPVSAVLPRPSGKGLALELSGQIDRLAVTADSVLIIDYKTNRPPPLKPEDVADAYLYQLAAYGLALKEIYPDKHIRAALLWTDGPRLMEIPAGLLDSYARRIWDLDVSRLDAS